MTIVIQDGMNPRQAVRPIDRTPNRSEYQASIMISRLRRAAISVLFLVILSFSTYAQNYPVETITILTHSRPGGGSDVFLRELSRYLTPKLGANIIVKNVTGGSGAAAIAELSRAKPDGSKFYATTPTFIYTSLLSQPAYTYKDVEPLVNLFFDPELIYTAADSSFQSLEDVLDKARSSRGLWGAANPGSLERQSLEQLKLATGLNAAVISHEGGGDLMINVLNRTLDIGVGEAQELQSQLAAGRLRVLATFSDARLSQFPNIPTVHELGYEVIVRKFRGIAAPKGLTTDLIIQWEQAIQTVLENPEYKASYLADSLLLNYINHSEYQGFIDEFASETEDYLRTVGIIE
ncbi:MAG: tripartite tricarboxylate transporter substrate-binding protein [Arenicellaceae bacterium]|nr:tripartite tricarboxylate transporter substrate-binding protein [Arenicellaceae bacterium]